MSNVVRTIYGNAAQCTTFLNQPPKLLPNSTINEILQIHTDQAPLDTDRSTLNYYCIGIGGHSARVGEGTVPRFELIKHKTTDAGLFNMIPLAMRPIENDLSDAERQDLAGRVLETHGGRQYYAYYLGRINKLNIDFQIMAHVNNDGIITTSPFEPDTDSLFPVAPSSNEGTYVVSGNTTSVIAPSGIDFTTAQINEILNVCRIKFGDESYAIISEIGLCCGIDRDIRVNAAAGGSFIQNEAIAVQIAAFIATMLDLQISNRNAGIDIDLGSAEQLAEYDQA